MLDPLMTSLSLGWILLAAGVISTFVIATYKSSYPTDLPSEGTERGNYDQDLNPVTRWCLVALFILLASYGAFRIHEDHDWLIFQRPHFYAGEINTK